MGPFTSYYSEFISFYRYFHTKMEGKKVRMNALCELIFFTSVLEHNHKNVSKAKKLRP